MLTDPRLKSQVDQLWDRFYSGGLANPLDAIEQFSYLLFLKRMEEAENRRKRQAERLGQDYEAMLLPGLRWSYWSNLPAEAALEHFKVKVFPALQKMGGQGSSFERYMKNAECKINSPALLINACRAIDAMEIGQQQQDIQGDLYEYLLGKLNTAGRNGQFRTPRHIIRMMVQMVAPRPMERIGDLAAGTCGFLVNAHQYILEAHTSAQILAYDEQGWPHHLIGDQLTDEERSALKNPKALRGFDNDSGMTMLRIGSMNLMLHGIDAPQFFYQDTLSRGFDPEREYDVILMNPPFMGAVEKSELHASLQATGTTKTELLFVHLILRALDMGGRCAVIVPEGVLFGSSKAHTALRRELVEENRLEGVISMPGGVFKPYAGVSTAVLLFTRGGTTGRIWFYDMAGDGFSLDDKRTPGAPNDIPDVVACWLNRTNAAFEAKRQKRLEELRGQLQPLNEERLRLEGEVHRLQFESALSATGNGPIAEQLAQMQATMEELKGRLNPVRTEFNQVERHFWVSKEQVKANKYDLSTSRYRQVEAEEVYYEQPEVTLERLKNLNSLIDSEIDALRKML